MLGQGSDWAVYELEGLPGSLARIFHQPLSFDRTEKIRIMAAARTPVLERWTDWPLDLLFLPDGRPIGSKIPVMAEHHGVRQLYHSRSRAAAFPHADWRFLVQVAASVAQAFAAVHALGNVVANVDDRGVLVGPDAHVRLADCDSFQVIAGGKCFPGGAGSPLFVAPELQGQPVAGLIRTENHDNFGLAVMIFLVLFMGHHPYAGDWQSADDMPIERAIREHRFARARDRALDGRTESPGTPPFDIVSVLVMQLFERAFSPLGTRGGRPTAAEWAVALEVLSSNLVECPVGLRHWYTEGLSECPWCRIEATTGIALFSPAAPETIAVAFDLRAFWKQVVAVEHPGSLPDVTAEAGEPDPSSAARRFVRRRAWHGPVAFAVAVIPAAVSFGIDLPAAGRGLLFLAAIVLYILVRLGLRATADDSQFAARESECRQRWEAIFAEWQAKAGSRRFEEKRLELERLKNWWEEASTQPQQRARIEAAIRRAFEDLQQIVQQIQFARATLREPAETAYQLLLQAQVDLGTVRPPKG